MGLTLLSLDDVKQCITMKEAIAAMEKAFMQLAKQEVVLPLRTGVEIKKENASFLTMPAYLAGQEVAGLKVVSIFPNNQAKNKPTINGAILLLSPHTGEVVALMEASYLTALRTGAVSGLATQYFASQDASEVAIIGAGVQAATQLAAVLEVRPIQRIKIWSRQAEKAEELAKKFEEAYEVQVSDSIKKAVKNADVICTATASTKPLIYLEDLKPTVHINAIGSHTALMQEIDEEVLANARVIADQKDAVLSEAGEIIKAVERKKLPKEEIKELGELLLSPQLDYQMQRTVFKSVGLAIQDMSIAQVVYENAQKKGIGGEFRL